MKTTIVLTSDSIRFDLEPENEVETLIVRELPTMQCERRNGRLVLTPSTNPENGSPYLEVPAFLRRFQGREEEQ